MVPIIHLRSSSHILSSPTYCRLAPLEIPFGPSPEGSLEVYYPNPTSLNTNFRAAFDEKSIYADAGKTTTIGNALSSAPTKCFLP